MSPLFLSANCTVWKLWNFTHKIFNKNNVKISYSCTRNISSIISGHNKSILRKQTTEVPKECNCQSREQCPMDNKCLTKNIVYEAEIKSHPDGEIKNYRGLCSTTFKDRYGVHMQGVRNKKYSKGCELTKYVWELKEGNKAFDIKWKILRKGGCVEMIRA